MEDREFMLVRWLSCFISVKHTIKFPVRFGGLSFDKRVQVGILNCGFTGFRYHW